MRKWVIFFPVTSVIWFSFVVVLGGLNYPNYEHISQFISELGATGAPHGKLLSLFGFVPVSILLILFVFYAIYLSSRRRKQVIGLICIGVYAVTLCIAAIYPCDYGCRPQSPSTSQNIHNLSAVIGYLSGIIGVFLLASDISMNENNKNLGLIGRGLGCVAIFTFLLLNPEFRFVGIAQRLFELSMYSWVILYALNFRICIFNKKTTNK